MPDPSAAVKASAVIPRWAALHGAALHGASCLGRAARPNPTRLPATGSLPYAAPPPVRRPCRGQPAPCRPVLVVARRARRSCAAGWPPRRLGVTTDTDSCSPPRCPGGSAQIALDRDFPQFNDLLVAVVDAATPEQADATAAGAGRGAGRRTTHFRERAAARRLALPGTQRAAVPRPDRRSPT